MEFLRNAWVVAWVYRGTLYSKAYPLLQSVNIAASPDERELAQHPPKITPIPGWCIYWSIVGVLKNLKGLSPPSVHHFEVR